MLRWLCNVNRWEEKNVAKALRVMAVEGKARKRRPMNTWERMIKKDLEKLSIIEELCKGKGLEDDYDDDEMLTGNVNNGVSLLT